MTSYLVRRLLFAIPVLLTVAVFVFLILHLIPGNPAQLLLGEDARQEDVERVSHKLGLDRPVLIQLFDWLLSVVRGDLGDSLRLNRPVLDILLSRADPTLPLAAISVSIAVVGGIPLGIVAAVNHNKLVDSLTMIGATIGVAIPPFWLGLMLILFISLPVGWLPAAGYNTFQESGLGALRYLMLPSIALGASQVTMIARMTRATMLEVIHEDYIRTARAKGLAERIVIYKHALRNSMISVLTVIGITTGLALGGAVVIEKVFALPGMGMLVIDSISRRDYPMVQGTILVISSVIVTVNLAVDVLYGFLDPRIRYE